MNVQIRDAAALRRVTPPMLRAYLESRGWERRQTWRDRIAVWSVERDGRSQEILTPLRESSDAYAVRMSETVAALSETEERSQLDVYYDLLAAGADAIRLRSLNGAGNEEWSLDEGAAVLENARKLILAAARSAERPNSPVHRGRASAVVFEYARGVAPILGYGGGRELTLHSPTPASYADSQTDFGDEVKPPFARQVTLALNGGLREAGKAARAAQAGESINLSFERAAGEGASANLCEAVAALAKLEHGIGVGVSWAASRPSKEPDGEFSFHESLGDALDDGAKWLRSVNPFMDAHVTGEIIHLSRVINEKFDGQAVVVYELDNRPITLHVKFEESDHDKVIRAFDESLEVSLYGDVHLEGRRHVLKNPRGLLVLGLNPETGKQGR